MLPERVYWEDGLRLDKQILDKSNTSIISKLQQSIFLPYNLEKGILSFELDELALDCGLIYIKRFVAYLDNKTYVNFNGEYQLSLQINNGEMAELFSLYINVEEKVIETEGVKYIHNNLSLSTEVNYSAKHSTQVGLFRFNNGCLSKEDFDYPLLSLDSYSCSNIFISINRLIAELKVFNKFVFSLSRPYATIQLNFLISRLERELLFAESNKVNAQPILLYNAIADICSFIFDNMDFNQFDEAKKTIPFSLQRPLSSFSSIINQCFELCKHKKIKNFVQFKLEGQKYVCDELPEEFFVADRHYLVVRKKQSVNSTEKFANKKLLRITSFSRNKNIVTLSLSGVGLEEIDSSMKNFAITLNNVDTVYQIKKGSEWDFILADRSAVFSSFPNSEIFEFFIAFL